MTVPAGARLLEYVALTIDTEAATRAALVDAHAAMSVLKNGAEIERAELPDVPWFRFAVFQRIAEGDQLTVELRTPPGFTAASHVKFTAEMCLLGQMDLEELDADFTDMIDGRACVICGCTEARACIGPDGRPCHWVAPFLCSNCAGIAREARP